jgi:aspartate/methionine/tyrosine aminotransferase
VRIDLFRMERNQSQHENFVDYNLSESGVLPMTVAEVLEGAMPTEEFLSLGLKYPQSNGTEELRARIGDFYGASAENVVVTAGGSEANYTSLWGLLEKGDRVAVMLPNYMQTWGLARAYGAAADAYWLTEQQQSGNPRWALDVEGLHRAVTKKTRVIVVTNPNNPTGGVLNQEEMDEIIRAARRANAWILADEIYRGAEINGAKVSPTFWGRYDKVLITSGLSKAFGLPGLRIGWIVGPPSNIAKLWSYRDYTTLSPGLLSERLAWMAMEPGRRERILARTRSLLRDHLPRLERWIHRHDDIFTYIPPVAGAIAYIRYRLNLPSLALCTRLRDEYSVLINPGDHFGGGKYLRVGFGYDMDYTMRGLERSDALLNQLKTRVSQPRSSRLRVARSGAA